ncbi:MAG: peptidyl-prolyl cis-trans isomerase B (cyclophilin B) [Myxococcota bacterium]|jgi:peptidyl-prolyl cis-trans isomerase B (cyclophilin B)
MQTLRILTVLALMASFASLAACESASTSRSSTADTATSPDSADTPVVEGTGPAPSVDEAIEVVIETSLGSIVLELDPAVAPITVANFLKFVDAGHYTDTLFHRVISDFMIQGGGFDTAYQQKETDGGIQSEADIAPSNRRGTVAMARTADPHSASAGFFINVVDNTFLDHTAKTADGWGYTVLGEVIEGMDVVDAIKVVPTGAAGPLSTDAPQEQVVIQSVARR